MGIPDDTEQAEGPPRKRSRLSLNHKVANNHAPAQMEKTSTVTISDDDDDIQSSNVSKTIAKSTVGSNTGTNFSSKTMCNDLVPPVASLLNLGNTCYMNCMLQVLRYTPGFLPVLKQLQKKIIEVEGCKTSSETCNPDEKSEAIEDKTQPLWQFIKSINQLFTSMEEKEYRYDIEATGDASSMAVSPIDLLDSIRAMNPMFEGSFQHDAQELLRCLLCYVEDAENELRHFKHNLQNKNLNKEIKPEVNQAGSITSNLTGKDLNGNEIIEFEKSNKVAKIENKKDASHLASSMIMEKENQEINKSRKSNKNNNTFINTIKSYLISNDNNKVKEKESTTSSTKTSKKESTMTVSKKRKSWPECSYPQVLDKMCMICGKDKSIVKKLGRPKLLKNLCRCQIKNNQYNENLECFLSENLKEKTSLSFSDNVPTHQGDFTRVKKKSSKVSLCLTPRSPVKNNICGNISELPLSDNLIAPTPPETESRYISNENKDMSSKNVIEKNACTGQTLCNKNAFEGYSQRNAKNNFLVTSTKPNDIIPSKLCSNDNSAFLNSNVHKKLVVRLQRCDLLLKEENKGLENIKMLAEVCTNTKMMHPNIQDIKTGQFSSVARKTLGKPFLPELDLKSKLNTTLAEKLFGGAMVHQTRCLECESYSKRQEVFMDISIPVTNPSTCDSDDEESSLDSGKIDGTVKECCLSRLMQSLSNVEVLRDKDKYLCNTCDTYVEAERSCLYEALPYVLTLHLKRFSATAGIFGGFSKLSNRVAIPLSLPCIYRECHDACTLENHKYSLFAVVTHSGASILHGHYRAYVKVQQLINPGIYYNLVKQKLKNDFSLSATDSFFQAATEPMSNKNFNHKSETCIKSDPCERKISSLSDTGDESYWLECDDECVKIMSQEEFENRLDETDGALMGTPYVLFYHKLLNIS